MGARPDAFSTHGASAFMVSYIWENFFRKDSSATDHDRALSENYLFKGLSKSEISFIKSLVHHRVYKAGESIFRQGELGIGMYIIIAGNISFSVEDGSSPDPQKARYITRLSAGDFFGEIALVEQAGRRTATATATSECSLLGFFKPDLAEVIERNPRLAVKILNRLGEVLARRLKETTSRLTEIKQERKDTETPGGN